MLGLDMDVIVFLCAVHILRLRLQNSCLRRASRSFSNGVETPVETNVKSSQYMIPIHLCCLFSVQRFELFALRPSNLVPALHMPLSICATAAF